MKVAVIIPAYNEAARIGALLERMPRQIDGNPVTLFVVDDGSRDKTASVARSHPGVHVISHRTNLGKGAAAKTGCDAAYHEGADFLVLMDADNQHRPEDIVRLLEPLKENPDVMVVGGRVFSKDMPFMTRLGNKSASYLHRLLFSIPVRDTQSGFRAFSRAVYPLVRWADPHYAMETEMLILAAKHKVPFREVAIDTIYLDNYKGTTPLDGIRIFKTLIKWKLLWSQEYSSLEPFSASSSPTSPS